MAEYAVEGTPPPRRKYIYAGDTRIAMIDYFGDLYFYLNDHLGSARVVVADSSGAAFDKYSYYAFGGNLSTTTSTNQTHRYTGKPLDEENGLNLYYYGARYYDSDVGVFRSVDPLQGKYPGWSPYAYTLNNPLRYIDPDGMETAEKDEASQGVVYTSPTTGVQMSKQDLVSQVNAAVKAGYENTKEAVGDAARAVGDAIVTTAEQLETPAEVVALGTGIVATVAALPVAATVATVATGVALTANGIQTLNDPTPSNLIETGVQISLTVAGAGAANKLRSMQSAGRLSYAQTSALTIGAGLAEFTLGQGAEGTINSGAGRASRQGHPRKER